MSTAGQPGRGDSSSTAPPMTEIRRQQRRAELDLMLGAFGQDFLHYSGATVSTWLEDGRDLSLSRRAGEIHLRVNPNRPGRRGERTWVFCDLEAAVTAWLTFDGETTPAGWVRRL